MSDPLFNDVLVLEHFENVGATDFTDVIGNNFTSVASATIANSTVIHGVGSGDVVVSGKAWQAPPTGISLNAEFTVEISLNMPSLPATAGIWQYGTGNDNNNRHGMLIYSDGRAEWYSVVAGGVTGDLIAGAGSIVAGVDYDIRCVVEGGTGYMLIDGVVAASGVFGATPATSDVFIGYSFAGSANYGQCYLDEFRVTNVSRGGGTYTPAFPFPDSASDADVEVTGAVQALPAVAAGEVLAGTAATITTPMTQLINFYSYGPMTAESITFALDKLTQIIIEIEAAREDCSDNIGGT